MKASVQPPPISPGIKATILAGSVTLALAIGGMSAGLPNIEAALAHTPADKFLTKMLVGVVGAAMVVGAPLTGFLSDRYGLRRVLFLNYLVFTVAGSAGLFLNDLHALVIARFLVGVGAAGAATASIVMINRLVPAAQRANWMGTYIAVSFTASLAMHPLVGMLAQMNWHYMFALCLAGAPFVIIALVSFDVVGADSSTRAAVIRDSERFLSWFPFRYAVLALMLGCIVYLPLIYTPFLLRDMGIGPARISLVLLADTVTGTVAACLFGHSRRYISAHGIFVCIFIATGLGSLVIALAPSYIVVMIGYALTGIGQGWIIPNLMLALATQVKPNQQGRAAGIVKASNYIAITVCVVLTERLSQIYGPRLPIALSSVLPFGLLLLMVYRLSVARRARGYDRHITFGVESP